MPSNNTSSSVPEAVPASAVKPVISKPIVGASPVPEASVTEIPSSPATEEAANDVVMNVSTPVCTKKPVPETFDKAERAASNA